MRFLVLAIFVLLFCCSGQCNEQTKQAAAKFCRDSNVKGAVSISGNVYWCEEHEIKKELPSLVEKPK